MERITFEGNFCDISMCRENPCPYNGMCSQRQTWERLKEYEETGIMPDDMGHWMDWFRAECEGRMVVLPCKVGDHILADGREAIVVWFFGYKTGRFLHVQFLDNAECADIPFYEIGKNRLSDHEEAEAALKGGEG